MNIIDPHLHLFNLEQGNYHWLQPDNAPFWPDKPMLLRNFYEQDLILSSPLLLTGFVHIEAGFDNDQPWREIQWLEAHCKLPFRSIAAIDITKPNLQFKKELMHLSSFQSVVGIRHILDDDAVNILNNDNCFKNLQYVEKKQFILECQLPLTDNNAVTALLKRLEQLPNLIIIIDHAGFPDTSNEQQYQRWLHNIEFIKKHPNIAIKCSGWEMVNRQYSGDCQLKVINACIDCFGEHNVMLASNFPLTLLSTSYQTYWQKLIKLNVHEEMLEKLCYTNSQHWYQIPQ
jgi:predicted TIM-barrel fold metal-dependent hydrolase